jgi:DNA-binding NarL/FixJ family response regulator
VIAAYQAGATVYQLGRRFSISCQTVNKILKSHGIPMRRTVSPQQTYQAARLYQDGWSLANIGERLAVSLETVRQRLLERGVRLRPRPGR